MLAQVLDQSVRSWAVGKLHREHCPRRASPTAPATVADSRRAVRARLVSARRASSSRARLRPSCSMNSLRSCVGRSGTAQHAQVNPGSLRGNAHILPSATMTDFRPMLAVSASTLPTGPAWTYEVKWDGYRALAIKDGGRVRLLSRNQKDLTRGLSSDRGGDWAAWAVAGRPRR
jgi:ATP-dependent DNA ligase